MLAYPLFDQPYTLETDVSSKGIGAVLVQGYGEDGLLHPITFASCSLNVTSISELETLAVVWAITHFSAYLYVTGPAKTGHVDINYTPSHNGSHLNIGIRKIAAFCNLCYSTRPIKC